MDRSQQTCNFEDVIGHIKAIMPNNPLCFTPYKERNAAFSTLQLSRNLASFHEKQKKKNKVREEEDTSKNKLFLAFEPKSCIGREIHKFLLLSLVLNARIIKLTANILFIVNEVSPSSRRASLVPPFLPPPQAVFNFSYSNNFDEAFLKI